jgi:hypothetical protein
MLFYQNIAAMQLQTTGKEVQSTDILVIIVEKPIELSRRAATFFLFEAYSAQFFCVTIRG